MKILEIEILGLENSAALKNSCLLFIYLFILVKKILELIIIVISDNSAISPAEVSHVVLIKMWASHHQVSHRSDV